MASYRHLARVAVVQAVFSAEMNSPARPEDTLAYLLEEFHSKANQSADFARSLLALTLSSRESAVKTIEFHAPEWPFAMIAPLDRSILLVGVTEMLYNNSDVPPIVAINEAIEIAKEYGGETSGKFVNGVLSSVLEHCLDAETIRAQARKTNGDHGLSSSGGANQNQVQGSESAPDGLHA